MEGREAREPRRKGGSQPALAAKLAVKPYALRFLEAEEPVSLPPNVFVSGPGPLLGREIMDSMA